MRYLSGMIRFALPLLLLASPAAAWEFRATTLCEMIHEEGATEVRVIYDPGLPEYAITIRRAVPWPQGPFFAIAFAGGASVTITTDRHELSEGGRAVTVRDRGFGNVLLGLEGNDFATAILGDTTLPFSLDGAADAVEEFRACRITPSV